MLLFIYCTNHADTNISPLDSIHCIDQQVLNILRDKGPLIQSGITAMSSMICFMGQNVFINNHPKYGMGGALASSTFQILLSLLIIQHPYMEMPYIHPVNM